MFRSAFKPGYCKAHWHTLGVSLSTGVPRCLIGCHWHLQLFASHWVGSFRGFQPRECVANSCMVTWDPAPSWVTVAEWFTVPCLLHAVRMVRGLSPSLVQTSTNACRHICKYVDQKCLAAMVTSIQSAGVAPEVNLRITQVRKDARDPPWIWNPGQTSPEVQNRGISGSTKRTSSKIEEKTSGRKEGMLVLQSSVSTEN